MTLNLKYLLLISDAERDHDNVPKAESITQARCTAVAVERWFEAQVVDSGEWAILTASRNVSQQVAELFWQICHVGTLHKKIEVTTELPPRLDLTAQDPRDYAHAVSRIYRHIMKQDLGGVTTCALVLERDVLNNLLSEFYKQQYEGIRPPPRVPLKPAEAYLLVVGTQTLVEFHGCE